MSDADNATSGSDEAFRLRRATRADAPALLELIVELAQFEKIPAPTQAEQQRLIEHGFGDRPRFEAWLAFWADVPTPSATPFCWKPIPLFTPVPRYTWRTCSSRRHIVGAASARRCCDTAFRSRTNAVASVWNGPASTGTKRRRPFMNVSARVICLSGTFTGSLGTA